MLVADVLDMSRDNYTCSYRINILTLLFFHSVRIMQSLYMICLFSVNDIEVDKNVQMYLHVPVVDGDC